MPSPKSGYTYNSAAACILLAIITVAVFSPSLFNDFQRGWNDQWQVLDNPYVTVFTWNYISYHFTEFYHGQYSPVNTLFYIITYALAGYEPLAFHAMSLIVHIVNVMLVFILVKMIITAQNTFTPKKVNIYSALSALVFAVHPMQVESVAWLSASKVLTFSLFTLLALIVYVRYINTGRYRMLIWVMLLYMLAFGCKEQAIILPLVLFTIDYIFGRFKDIKPKPGTLLKPLFIEKIPFFVMALLMWYFSAIHNLGNITDANAYPFYQRLMFGAHSLVVYIFRFIAPVKMYYFYFYPMTKGEPLPLMFWAYPLLLAIIVWFGIEQYRKGNRLTVFGLMFFAVNLLLVIHILPMPRKMITADRYMYLSIVGLAIATIPFIDRIVTQLKRNTIIAYAGALTVWFLSIGAYSTYRTTQWKDSTTIKQNIKELIDKRKAAGEKGLVNPVNDKPGRKHPTPEY